MAHRDRIDCPGSGGRRGDARGSGLKAPAALIAWLLAAAACSAQVALEDYVARSLARIGLVDLRMQRQADPADYEIAALLFAEAGRWSPDDEILLRKEIDAWWAAGDERRALTLTRRLLKLDLRDGKLDDEVSLLRILIADISSLQTVEERLARYETLLARTDVPAPVRSRLALDAALLLREQGDVNGFATMLTRATALDSTHKEAATLAATYYASQSSDPVGRLEAMLNVLLADPVDLNVHLSISRALSGDGAYDAALAFHRAAMSLVSAGGQQPPEEIRLESIALRWMVWGPTGLAEEMEQPLIEQRAMLAETIMRRQRAQQPIDDLPRPDQILPSVPEARLRSLLAGAEGDQAGATRAVRDLTGATTALLNQLGSSAQDDAGVAQVAIYGRQLMVELQAVRLITGVQLDLAALDLAALDEELNGEEQPPWLAQVDPAELDLVRRTLRAVMALHRVQQGEWDALEDAWALREMGQLGQIVLAESQVELGLTEDAAATFRAVLERRRLSLWSGWARNRLLEIAPAMAAPPQIALALTEVVRQVPDWIWRSTSDPSRFMALLLRAESLVEPPLGGGMVRLRIRNDAPAPIAMGPSRPISTRFLLSPKLEIGPRNAGAFAIPEVVNVDRRLRLEPREVFDVELWAGAGVAGWFLESAATSTCRVRWRALQGFVVTQTGGYATGPMCLSAETELTRRDMVEETQLSARELAQRLGSDGEDALAVTCLAIRALYIGPDARPIPEELAGALVDVAARRYPTLSPAGRMGMLLGLPNAAMNPAMEQFDAAAREETDPRVLAAVLLTRVTDPADPALERAQTGDDAGIAQLAELLAQRLEESDTGTYARFQELPTGIPLRAGGGR